MRILHAADLHLREDPPYGKLDPETGLNVRFLDQRRLLTSLVDVAIDERVDAVLISGDAFHHRRPTPLVYTTLEHAVDRLRSAKIPVVISGGNHDGDPAAGQVSAVDVLAGRARVFSRSPAVEMVGTESGPFQLFALPHIPRSRLLTSDAYKDLSPEATYQVLAEKAHDLLRSLQALRDRRVPAVLMAHASVAGAKLGSEQTIGFGNEVVLNLRQLLDLKYDVVALGHIHRGQQLEANVAYAGAMYRVSFDEEREDKGVWIHDIGTSPGVRSEFIDLGDRPYLTLDVHRATEGLAKVTDAIVRVTGNLTSEEAASVDGAAFCRQLETMGALTASWQVETARTAAVRVSGMSETMTPAVALDAYLREHPELPGDAVRDRGRSLIAGEPIDVASSPVPSPAAAPTPVEVAS